MGNNFLSMAILFLTFFIFSSCFQNANGNTSVSVSQNTRETLEILFGGGGHPPYSSTNPESQCTPAPPPTLSPLEQAFGVIQRFRKVISSDPRGITNTWNGTNVCAYKGFRCDKIPTDNTLRVSGVNLNENNLNGNQLTISGFLDQLPDLAYFHVNSNNFTGSILPQISKFRFLFELDVSNNKLTGPFPDSVLGATQLTFLDLRFNFFTGPLNPQVFNLNLDFLFLNNNQFTGEIPDNLGDTSAHYLTLANNNFTGSIPESIGQAKTTLLEVLLLNNQLSGCLPYEIGLLEMATLFDASMNQLTGPIPRSFACLDSMQLLNLSFNQLYGTVPEELCQLGDLMNLTLSFNYFTEVGPECRELIERNMLDVRMNCIQDLPFQKSMDECAAFFSMERECPDEKSMHYLPCDIEDFASRKTWPDGKILIPPVPAPSPSYAALERHRKMDLP